DWNRQLGELVLQPRQLGGVRIELHGAGPPLPEDLANEDQASDVQEQVVDIARPHAASSAGTNSSIPSASAGATGFDSTSRAATTAPTRANAARTEKAISNPCVKAAPPSGLEAGCTST